MTEFDIVVLLIVGLSALISLLRGAVREIIALAGWIAAFFIASIYVLPFASLMPEAIPGSSLKLLVAFVILFVVTLVVTGIVGLLLSALVKAVGLTALDRGIGVMFGLARGGLIVLVGVLLAGLTSMPKERFWRDAVLSRPLEQAAMGVKPYLPEGLSRRIDYPRSPA